MVKNIGIIGDSIAHGYYDEQNRKLKELYKDATHPNAQGHQIMADEIYDYLTANGFI